jgi:hypothetical protein
LFAQSIAAVQEKIQARLPNTDEDVFPSSPNTPQVNDISEEPTPPQGMTKFQMQMSGQWNQQVLARQSERESVFPEVSIPTFSHPFRIIGLIYAIDYEY